MFQHFTYFILYIVINYLTIIVKILECSQTLEKINYDKKRKLSSEI